jgi:hypothetical protein
MEAMMLALDWRILDRNKALSTIQEAGIEEIRGLSISEILDALHLGSTADTQESFPKNSTDKSSQVDISTCVSDLKLRNVVRDVIGTLKFHSGSRMYFSTLVSMCPREYLLHYVEVAKRLQKECGELTFTVWLDDRLSVINNDWHTGNIQKGVDIFRDYFIGKDPNCNLLVSSQVSAGIPLDFANSYLSKVTGGDLISILPYRLRYPWSTRIIDVAHFAWMCYLAQRCPGIHFAGANNKRHYQIFRSKVAGKGLTVLLFKLGSEKPVITVGNVPR